MPYFYTPKNVGPGQLKTFVSLIECSDTDSYADILERIFAACNRGSGKEDPHFVDARIPSLSVGDKVTLVMENDGEYEQRTFVCEPLGWRSL